MEKQKNMPQLRFPEFEGEWENLKLGELSKSIHSGKDSNVFDGNYPLYGSMGIIGKSSSPTYEGKYILVARVGANAGSINLVEDSFGVTDNTLVIENDSRIDTDFEYYLLKVANLNRYIFGSGQPLVTGSMLKALKVLIPSLPEQLKIASFFTAIDQKISQLKRKKTLLEQYKKGVMQKIFSQEIRFKDDNGHEFPKWEKKKLGELTYKTGKKNKGSTPYPIYSINNREGFLPQGDQFEGVDSNSRGYDISLYKIIEEKTFAYNPARINVGSIGFSGDLKDIIISSLYVCFKTKQGLEDAYLHHYLKTFQFNKSVLQNVEGGVRDYLFYENFSNIKINLPSNKEQLKIANFLSAIDDKINHTQKQVEKAEVWKKGLMQQMFC
jgi:type I restriction enzyme S subunit